MGDYSEKQAAVLERFKETPNVDVPIADVYRLAYPDGGAGNTREMQQKLGPLLTRLNRKIAPSVIAPGELKRTYRMRTKG